MHNKSFISVWKYRKINWWLKLWSWKLLIIFNERIGDFVLQTNVTQQFTTIKFSREQWHLEQNCTRTIRLWISFRTTFFITKTTVTSSKLCCCFIMKRRTKTLNAAAAFQKCNWNQLKAVKKLKRVWMYFLRVIEHVSKHIILFEW